MPESQVRGKGRLCYHQPPARMLSACLTLVTLRAVWAATGPGQFFHRRSHLGHVGPQLGDHRCLRRWRCGFPELWRQRWMSVHRALTLPPGASSDKGFVPQPRERLRRKKCVSNA